ncbi:hypothetical protein BSG66_04195 [Campylobacter jejuni]|nr:hypothetical protein [Campylobacter jejuni]EAK7021459.1 hypothetical protein [Campylobacter jejuni]EAL2996030.1 hypothetical protein [Campylobacter jejuni]EAL6195490.1 hypothetical protein [Campylobacter jejuni]EAL7628748.1 hypothetical protein [Campylobacter jejuni]
MLGIVFSLFSVFLLVFMLYKKINAHMALLLSGLLLLSLAALFGLSPHICRRKNKISIWKNKTSIKVEILFFYKP